MSKLLKKDQFLKALRLVNNVHETLDYYNWDWEELYKFDEEGNILDKEDEAYLVKYMEFIINNAEELKEILKGRVGESG